MMLSGDGSTLAIEGYVGDPAPENQGLWAYDLDTDTAELLATAPEFGQVTGPTISDDGRFVAYTKSDPDKSETYRFDRQSGTERFVGYNPDGTPADSFGKNTGISADGSMVVFSRGDGLIVATITECGSGPIPVALDPPAPPEDGLWSWGSNGYGELGDGSAGGWQSTPVRVTGFTDVDALAAGAYHSLALVNGEVWAWGSGEYGQLGNGTTPTAQSTPVKVSSLTGADAVAAGRRHSLALVDGEVWAWGSDWATFAHSTPVKVVGLTGVDAIAAGGTHSLALVDGEVWAWGDGYFGQLGDGVTSGVGPTWSRSTPVKVIGLSGVDAIAAGDTHSFALVDGEVWAWGYGPYLGIGITQSWERSPIHVAALSGVDEITAGPYHTFALVDGEAWAWGFNYYGQFGDGSTTSQSAPVRVPARDGADEIEAAGSRTMAVEDGAVWSSGNGYLGNGTTSYAQTTPVRLSALTSVAGIAGGALHTLAMGTASPTNGVTSGSAQAPAGATVTSDVGGGGPTVEEPVTVSVTTPNTGVVSIATHSEGFSGAGFYAVGREVDIQAPTATAADPLTITFTLDVSIFPTSWDLSWAYILRDGTFYNAPCISVSAADPDPCIVSRTRLANGDVELVVRTSHASEWAVLVRSLAVDAGGPYSVPEGSSIQLNGSASGAAPYSFVWDLAPGLFDPTVAAAVFRGLDDGVTPIRLTAVDSLGLLGEDTGQVTVTNALPTVGAIVPAQKNMKANTQIKVSASFADAGIRDRHTATWSWGDGKSNGGSVTESNGSGTVAGNHVFQKKGTYTVTLTVRDDDGGTRQRTLVLTLT
jgi:alpha-tubulin suppressor-like RCC1 family protein